MKKLSIFCSTIALSAMCFIGSVSAIDLVVDNNKLELDVEPTVIDGRTLVPIRAIFEKLGATVEWDQSTMTATATRGSDIVEITLNSPTAYINGVPQALDVPATAIEGRTLVPVRFVSEALNAKVYWVQDTQTVRVATQVYDVVRVVDGDTIVVNYNGTEEKVRLIGVDTPESVHPDSSKNTEEGVAASDYTKQHLEGKQVELEFDVQERDQYGRLLAYVYVDGVMYNKTLLEDGVADLATYPPNVKYVDDFTAIVEKRTYGQPQEQDNIETSVKTSGTYVGSVDSDKYHNPSCRYAEIIEASNQIWFDTVEEATAAGYSPCGVCKP